MPKPPGTRGHQLVERIMRLFFDREEAAEVMRDLHELRADKSRFGGAVYFWTELLKYPVRSVADRWRYRESHGVLGAGGTRMEAMWKDARYAVRSLTRSAGFAIMAVVILAVSMGATTAVLSVVKGVLLDPLPFSEPERLHSVWLAEQDGTQHRTTPAHHMDVRSLSEVFEHVAAFRGHTASLTTSTEPLFLRGGEVTYEYFDALGVSPILGRAFTSEDTEPDAAPVVVLSHRLWQQAFGSDPGVLGRVVELNGVGREVLGVAPPGVFPLTATVSAEIPFTTSNQDYFLPLRWSEATWSNRRSHILGTIARLRQGVAEASAATSIATMSARIQATEALNANEHLTMNPFTEEVVGDLRFALMAILGTVGLVLLIAVANVGALFVLRADDRRTELEVRVAMGAPWARLIRQFLFESLAVVGVASLGAILMARWSIGLMQRLVPYQIPRLSEVQVDGSTLLLTLAMGLALAFGFALFTAVRSFRSGGLTTNRHATAGLRQRRVQGSVVALQAGLGVVVLVGALLLSRSFIALRAVDTGFAAMETWVLPLQAARGTALDEVLRRVRDLPGVASAALTYDHPLNRSWGDGFRIRGVEPPPESENPSGSLRPFGEGYFDAAGIAVVQGRIPDAIDLAGPVAYAVVNEALRDAYFPDGGVVGATLEVPTAGRIFGEEHAFFEVIGVVRDVRFLGPETPSEPAFYLPLTHFAVGGSTLLVRPETASVDVLAGVRRVIRETDASLAIQTARRLGGILDDRLARPRFNMMLLVSLAGMGLILCGLGAYALVGRVVVARFREIGIRMALGADSRSVANSVLGSALRPIVFGGSVGLVAAFGIARLLRSILFEVTPGDPMSFVLSPVFLIVVGLLAAVIPVRRAISVDPAHTLRIE